MAEKRKISVRKVLQLLVTLVVTVGCITAMISASRIEDRKTVKGVAVHISNDKKYHFIEQQEILELAIRKPQVDLEHTPASGLDLNSMERTIMADPWVARAQVYVDNEGMLQMNVLERIPVVRVFDRNNRSYYLDTSLSIMPVSNNYVYYCTVVTNMPDLGNDSLGWALRKDVVSLVRTLQADTFWSQQISQVIVDSPGIFELTPVLGDQRILLGSVAGTREKLNNLFLFYKKVLNRIGWDKYELLDLRFHGQVVASPALPYKGPVDKAAVTMNWINSIVETEAKKDAEDSAKTGAKSVINPNKKAIADPKKGVPKLAAKPGTPGKGTPAKGSVKGIKQAQGIHKKQTNTGNQQKGKKGTNHN